MVYPIVFVVNLGFDGVCTYIPHVTNAVSNPVDVLFDRLDHTRENRRAAGASDHEQIWEAA